MKGAPWVALAAIGLLVGVTAWAERPATSPEVELSLDFTGVDTLDVSGVDNEIVLVMPGTATLAKHPDRLPPVVRREGGTLVVSAPAGAGNYEVQILAPTTLQRLVGPRGSIVASARVVDLEIERSGGSWTTWRGDATRLRIVSRRIPQCRESCRNQLNIDKGNIGHLSVSLQSGTVAIGETESIRSIELELGEDAEYELGGLHGPPPPLKITRLDETAAGSPALQVAAPGPAPEPPRPD